MPKQSGFVRIPKERVGVLVGPEGKIKAYIENKLNVKLQVDSEAGDVTIFLGEKAEDPSVLFRARDVVSAIGRGFAPEHAVRMIWAEDTVFDVIDLREVFGRSGCGLKGI